jgi:hypothetical protein
MASEPNGRVSELLAARDRFLALIPLSVIPVSAGLHETSLGARPLIGPRER